MDRKKSSVKKPRIRRPAKLEGAQAFLHVRVPNDEKRTFIDLCRERNIGASQVVREAMRAITSGRWTPPSLRKSRRKQ